jgi:hypothetical protein
VGLTPHATGALGAMEAWGRWAPGLVLLWLTGLGLYGFAGWRGMQALLDADRQGRTPRALAARTGQAISGLVYGGLAISVFGVIDTLEDLYEADDRMDTQAAVGRMLEWPAGPWLVAGVGVFILGVGVGGLAQAIGRDLVRRLQCSEGLGRIAALVGRVGYFARGLAFIAAGGLMAKAGVAARAADAGGLGAALDVLKVQPFGRPALALVALGLIAFGLFAYVEAVFREIRAGAALERLT